MCKPVLAAITLVLFLAPTIIAESVLADPGIPNGEIAVYRQDVEGTVTSYRETVSIKNTGKADFYEIIHSADRENSVVRINRRNMVPFFVKTVTRHNDFVSENINSIIFESELSYQDIKILSFSDIAHTLRGFPFAEKSPMKVTFFSSQEEDEDPMFSIDVRVVAPEAVTIRAKSIDCYKLELRFKGSGILRIFSGLMPKTYFWYSAEKPHYLVAYEGTSGAPGSPKRRVEIFDYSGWR